MDAEIHFFHCGNGDTILIRGGDEWALVDANLTHRSGARDRLAAVLREREVKRLRFVCVTHFDEDHIRGLGSFLRTHFGPNGREREQWEIEQMILPVRHDVRWEFLETHRQFFARRAPRGAVADSSLEDLFATLSDIYVRDDGIFHCYSPGTKLVARNLHPPSATLGPWEVAFLGPNDTAESRYAVAFRDRWSLSQWPRDQWPRRLRLAIGNNETSRIVALRHTALGDTVLLTGDAPATAISEALQHWENLHHGAGASLRRTFRVVKASHHGACTEREDDNCHHPELYQQSCEEGHSHVVISCRDHDESHPHEDVLVCVRGARLKCLSTGAPLARSAQTRRGTGSPRGLRRQASGRDVIVRHDARGFSIDSGYVR